MKNSRSGEKDEMKSGRRSANAISDSGNFILRSRPRASHPATLITLPDSRTSKSANPSGTRHVSQESECGRRRDGWIPLDQKEAERSRKGPKPSHSAKKLAKPSILFSSVEKSLLSSQVNNGSSSSKICEEGNRTPVKPNITTTADGTNGSQSAKQSVPGLCTITLPGFPSIVKKVANPSVVKKVSKDEMPRKLSERFQVNRTAEERDRSPESIRLDGMGLKSFPQILGGEAPTLKLLSLQHNLITRLENSSQLNHLLVLDLYDNRLERITGLQGLTSLRVLLLGKNRIRRLEGMESLKRLEILDLHGNQLRYADNLGVLSGLRVLNLAGNHLRSIRNLGPYGLSSLTELNLKRNRIRNVDGLVKAPHLKKLLLSNNDLQSLLPLRKLVFLQELMLDGNPLCSSPDLKEQVVSMIPWLAILDRWTITDGMRAEAKEWQKRKQKEEEARRKEEARLRTTSPTGGPPNSREQAIYQARRRWESVKNFVKNSNCKATNPSTTVVETTVAEQKTLSPVDLESILVSSSELSCPASMINDTEVKSEQPEFTNERLSASASEDLQDLQETLVLEEKSNSDCKDDNTLSDNVNINEVVTSDGGADGMGKKSEDDLVRIAVVRPLVRETNFDEDVSPRTAQTSGSGGANDAPELTATMLETSGNDLDSDKIGRCNQNVGPRRSMLRRSASTSMDICPSSTNQEENDILGKNNKPKLEKLRSVSLDAGSHAFSDDDEDDTCSIATTTTTATTSDVSPRPKLLNSRKQLFPRTKAQRIKLREKNLQRIQLVSTMTKSKVGAPNMKLVDNKPKMLRRCDSATVIGIVQESNCEESPVFKKQGTDYLVEIDNKILSIYGQGALKHSLGFPGNVTCSVTTAKFHYISYDSIIPFFGKLRQIYPSLEHFQFRANNISRLGQLNALSDLQGLSSLHVAKEGNPLVFQDVMWTHYATYRLSHWGLQVVNGKEVSCDYRGGLNPHCFESLGFLALSCLPQTALTPLAKRLHMLHCFCCCSPSSSSEESGKIKAHKSVSPVPHSDTGFSTSICTSWDEDPLLLDVIGKEALVYCPSTQLPLQDVASAGEQLKLNSSGDDSKDKRHNILDDIVDSGVEILEKLDRFEKEWPVLLRDMIVEILMDYKFMDGYMKKELKKCQDATTIALHNSNSSTKRN